MLNRNFTFTRDHDRGVWGLRANWMDNADPASGELCLHDMLEHFPTQTSALEGECEALGAFMVLRLEHRSEEASSNGRALGGDIHACLRDAMEYDLPLPSLLRTRPLSEESELVLESALAYGYRQLVDEYQGELHRLQEVQAPLVREALRSWVRRGYRRAKQRYANVDTYYLGTTVFNGAAKTLDKLKPYLAEGDQVGVSIDLQELAVYVRLNGRPAMDLVGQL